MMCHKWSCPTCSKFKADYWKKLALAGKAERFITLTYPNDGTKTTIEMAGDMKRAWPKLLAKVRKVWGAFEYLLIWELTKKGAPHIHMLQRGAWIDKQWLSDTWAALVGAPVVSIRKIDDQDRAALYVTKYMGKSLAETVVALPQYRVIQRSQGWVVEDATASSAVEPKNGPSFTKWIWSREEMEALVDRALNHYDWQHVPGGGPDCFTLMAPDLPDAVDILLYDGEEP